jgi:hypothetical protein
MAVALLKDRKGNIHFDLTVKGDTSDPNFDPGFTVMDAVSEMVLRLVTSPFAALGGIFAGEKDEFDHIPFEFGSAHLDLEAQERLDLLADGLTERPAIKVEITGMADSIMDRHALAEADLLDHLKTLRLEELASAGNKAPESIEEIVLSEDEYDRLLIKAFREKFGVASAPSTKKEGEELGHEVTVRKKISAVETAKQSLIEAIPVDQSRLKQLAEQRALKIKAHLIENGHIPSDRLVVREAGIKEAWREEVAQALISLTGE